MGRPLRVLIAEDCEGDARLVLIELEDCGFTPKHVRVETREAMVAALKREDWDIVIADYFIPGFGGPDALVLLHETGIDIPFIVVSGKIGEETAVEAMKAGAHDYIMKGNLSRLAPAIKRETHQAEERQRRREAEEALRTRQEELQTANEELHEQSRLLSDQKTELERKNREVETLNHSLYRQMEEIRKLQEEKVQSERLATIGQLASIVAHELRNPLGTIGNSLHYLKSRRPGAGDERMSWHLEASARAVASASRIIEDLLDYARPKQPAFAPISLCAVLDEALALCASGDKVEMFRDFPPDIPPVSGDPEMLRRVFINVITNAVQAMPEGGRLEASVRADGAWQEASLRDHGVGIPPEVQGRIFEPLFSTKAKGVGLGLYISKRTVTEHGGTITIESVPGKETTVTVRLPQQRGAP